MEVQKSLGSEDLARPDEERRRHNSRGAGGVPSRNAKLAKFRGGEYHRPLRDPRGGYLTGAATSSSTPQSNFPIVSEAKQGAR